MVSKRDSRASLELLEQRLLLSGQTVLADLFQAAQIIDINPTDSITLDGNVLLSGQTHMYGFTAPARGSLYVEMDALDESLDPMLELYNSQGGRLSLNDNASAGTLDSRIKLAVSAGQTYYVLAEGNKGTSGAYGLTLTSDPVDDAENILEAARYLPMRAGRTAMYGVFNYAGDVDVMRIVTQYDGPMDIQVSGVSRLNDVTTELFVYDAAGNLVAHDGSGASSARTSIDVSAQETYYVKVAGTYGGTQGQYRLNVAQPVDDYRKTLADAREIQMRYGRARAAGRINYSGDVDVMRFVTKYDGPMEIHLSGHTQQADTTTELFVYDGAGNLVAHDGGSSTDSYASLSVYAGETYYVKVAGSFNGTPSRYSLNIVQPVDDFRNASANARDIWLRNGRAVVNGRIDYPNDSDAMRVVAISTAPMEIDLADTDRAVAFEGELFVYDADGNQIAHDAGGASSHLTIAATEGQTYYIKVSGTYADQPTRYSLTVRCPVDDASNTFDRARFISLNSYASAAMIGRMDFPGDVDMMSIIATKTGLMTVTLTPCASQNPLGPEMFVYDSQQEQIAHDSDGSGLSAEVSFSVLEGETYYLKVGSLNDATGSRYVVRIITTDQPIPDPQDDPGPAPGPDDPLPGSSIVADIISQAAGRQLRVAGTNSVDTITFSQSGGATTLTTSFGTQSFEGPFDSILIYGFDGADTIRITNTVSIESLIYGGAGNDSIFCAGGAPATIVAGGGNDLIVTVGGSGAKVYGQTGLDSFWYNRTDTIADVSADESAAQSTHVIGEFYQPFTTDQGSSLYVSTNIAGQALADPTSTSSAAGWVNFADVPLFVNGPEYNDIAQGAIGDCYYLACLASLADTDPTIIQQMVAPLGDGTYAVRFFSSGQEVYLRVDADLPVTSSGSLAYAKTGPDGELWVPIVEKAYAFFRYGQNSYASINGGWMSTTYREITGNYTTTSLLTDPADTLYNYFATQLAQGHAVTLGSEYSAVSPVVGGHAYMVKSAQIIGGQRYLTVFNPWGGDGRDWDSNPGDGLLTLSMEQVQTNFSAAVVSLA